MNVGCTTTCLMNAIDWSVHCLSCYVVWPLVDCRGLSASRSCCRSLRSTSFITRPCVGFPMVCVPRATSIANHGNGMQYNTNANKHDQVALINVMGLLRLRSSTPFRLADLTIKLAPTQSFRGSCHERAPCTCWSYVLPIRPALDHFCYFNRVSMVSVPSATFIAMCRNRGGALQHQ